MVQVSQRVAIALAEAENVLAIYLMVDLNRVRIFPRSYKKAAEGNSEFTLKCEFTLFRDKKEKRQVYIILHREEILKDVFVWNPVAALIVNNEFKTHWRFEHEKWIQIS